MFVRSNFRKIFPKNLIVLKHLQSALCHPGSNWENKFGKSITRVELPTDI